MRAHYNPCSFLSIDVDSAQACQACQAISTVDHTTPPIVSQVRRPRKVGVRGGPRFCRNPRGESLSVASRVLPLLSHLVYIQYLAKLEGSFSFAFATR